MKSFAVVIFTMLLIGAAPAPEPRLGLFFEKGDIERARGRCETVPWAKNHRERSIKIADEWLNRSDEWIRQIMPPPGSKFSYGTAGCPECGKEWGRFGQKVASFDRTLYLKCPHCRTEFDLTKSEGEYADIGDGVVVNGKRFFLRGVWNAFVVQSMWAAFDFEASGLTNLGDAYALTGDDRYARKAIVITDALATLSPKTLGPRDFSDKLDSDEGRLQHLTSIFFRAQVHLARVLDLVGRHPSLQEPSPTNPSAGSVWDNIKAGIFDEYLFNPIDTRGGKLHTLHNHEADSVRALLLHGLMFGNADHLRWAANDVRAFLDNTIDRDGLYYETSLGYADFTRSVFIDMAELLVRYDPTKYPPVAKMPRRDELPLNGNYFDHDGLARLTIDAQTRTNMLGRASTFGNNHWDELVWKKPGRPFNAWENMQVQRFVRYASDPALRERAAEHAASIQAQSDGKGAGGWWILYRSLDDDELRDIAGATKASKPAPIAAASESDFFGQTGNVFLRSGEGAHRRGAFLRVGPNMPHAHDDQLGLLLFANGRALSGDVGYGIFGNHVHLGWAGRAIAHHGVVINQDESGKDRLFRIGPGGTIERFHAGPGVAWAEASLTQMYEKSDNVRDVRRLVMQLDLSPERSYWIDLYDVDGGRVHDYSMHAPPGSFAVEGVSPVKQDGVWTLAGLDPKWRDAFFDAPGRAWGERLGIDGMIKRLEGTSHEDDAPAKRGWHPPPGNGYGFLHDVASADTSTPWSATWKWDEKDDRYGLRLTMLPERPHKLITASGPTITGAEQMRFVVARSGDPSGAENVRTRYAGVLEAFGEKPSLSTEAIRQNDRIVGLRVRDADHREDIILDARGGGIADPQLDNGLAVIRRIDGRLESLVLSGGMRIEADGVSLAFEQPRWTGKLTGIADNGRAFVVAPVPPSSVLGSTALINNPGYSHGSAYRIGARSSNGALTPLNAGLTLGRARVDTVTDGGFVSTAPLVFGFIYDSSTRFLDGKSIVSGAKSGRVRAMTGFKKVQTSGIDFAPGDEFTVYDVQAGDTVTIEATANLTRDDQGRWTMRANMPVTVSFPSKRFVIDAAALARGPVTLEVSP